MFVSKVAEMQIIRYSTIYSTKNEFDWDLSCDIISITDIRQKKRMFKV